MDNKPNPAYPPKRILRITVSVLASVLLITVLYFIYVFYSLSPNVLYHQIYKPYELPSNYPSSSSANAYREHNYREVIALVKKDSSSASCFLAAMSSLESGHTEKAIGLFNRSTLPGPTDSIQKNATEFYLALAYLLNKDYDLALPLLRAINDDKDHPYHDKITLKLIRKVKLLKWR